MVIPCYNSGKTLREAVDSVLKQSDGDFELILVDDGSTDDTAGVIESLTDPRIKPVRQPNMGASAARNTGIRAASGVYVAFLDSDDIWFPSFLEKTTALLDNDPQAGMAAANQFWQKHPSDRDTTFHECARFDSSRGEILFEDLIRRNIVSTSACVVRRDLILQCGCFDEELKVAEDYHLWLKIAASRKKIHAISEPLGVSRRFVSESLVKDKLLMARFGLLCLDKFYQSHGHLLTRAERKAFARMRRNTWLGLLYRSLRMRLRRFTGGNK